MGVHGQPKSYFVYRLDGDNLRFGLDKDLGFTPADRKENVRRVAEVSKLFAEAGAIVIAGLISPYKADRNYAREIHVNASLPFMEVFIDAPLKEVEARDPKGLYKKAREGKIKGFTGIDAPYEAPENPEVHCRTDQLSITQSANKIMEELDKAGIHLHGTFRPVPEPTEEGTCSGAGAPHGGALVSTVISDAALKKKLIAEAAATVELSERQACDVALITFGGFSPLNGFMKKADYEGVVENMRLASGVLFSLPVVLDVTDTSLQGKKVLLKYNGVDMAVMDAEEVWKPNKVKEAKSSYGTTSMEHPSVQELFESLGKYYVGGKVHGLMASLNDVWGGMGNAFKTPAEVRKSLPSGKPVVAFQNRNPVHKAHFELLLNAKEDVKDSIILVHPTVGPTQPGDIDGKARIKTYEVMQEEPFYHKWAGDAFRWAYLPYSMKMAGPREAIQHMIIRKNFGATHLIIGRDMAGTKSTITGDDFYGPYDAQEMGKKFSAELGVTVTHYENMVYVGPEEGCIQESVAKKRGLKVVKLSGTEFRRRLRSDEEIPEWFSFKSVVDILRKAGDAAFC